MTAPTYENALDVPLELAGQRLDQALQGLQIAGVQTNVDLIRRILHTPAFEQGQVDTHLIEHHQTALMAPPSEQAEAMAAAGLTVLRANQGALQRLLAGQCQQLPHKRRGAVGVDVPHQRRPGDQAARQFGQAHAGVVRQGLDAAVIAFEHDAAGRGCRGMRCGRRARSYTTGAPMRSAIRGSIGTAWS